VLWRHGVRPVANMIVNKVTTDSALVIDAVEAVCTNAIDAVAICSGDADFVPLATWLREKGCQVWCFSLADRIFANPESFYDDVVLMELVDLPPPSSAAAEPAVAPPASPAPPDLAQQILTAFPALRGGQQQHLNQVVAALRQKGILSKSDKTAEWFRQNAGAFHLSPAVAPNRICYEPQAGDASPKATPSTTLLQNAQVMPLLRRAVQASQDDQGWVLVSSMRKHLGNKEVFDVRVHGFATLTKLLAATGMFELRGVGTPQVAVRLTAAATVAPVCTAASAVVAWPSASGRRAPLPLPPPLHALRASLQQLAMQRVQHEDVLKAVPELVFGTPCALHSVAGRLREHGLLGPSQSALRILERYPQSFEVNLSHHPQTVRHIGSVTA